MSEQVGRQTHSLESSNSLGRMSYTAVGGQTHQHTGSPCRLVMKPCHPEQEVLRTEPATFQYITKQRSLRLDSGEGILVS